MAPVRFAEPIVQGEEKVIQPLRGKAGFSVRAKAKPRGAFIARRRLQPESFVPYEEMPDERLIETLFSQARAAGAEEIRIEPDGAVARVRFRIDGRLHDISRHDLDLHEAVLNRLKAMARLRTDERFAAQRGRLRGHWGGETSEIVIDVAPLPSGEKLVATLGPVSAPARLDELGLTGPDAVRVRSALEASRGLILIAAPKGSGKAATTAAFARTLSDAGTDVLCIEARREADMPGIHQVELGRGLTLAAALRAAALRAALEGTTGAIALPELRDEESLRLAVGAGTERLVIAQIRAGGAVEAFVRLSERGLEPEAVARSLSLIVTPRLLRKICPHCSRAVELGREEARAAGIPEASLEAAFGERETLVVRGGAKCDRCRFTGFLGRRAIFETLEPDPVLRALVMSGASLEEQAREAAGRLGAGLLAHGFDCVAAGETTLDELVRVATRR